MSFKPKIPPRQFSFYQKKCTCCGTTRGPEEFAHSNSLFYPDGTYPICNECIEKLLRDNEYNWEMVDKICQLGDIPFVPKEWERLRDINGAATFPIYANVFSGSTYENIGWSDYYVQFKELKEKGIIQDELPVISEEKLSKLQNKWGANYTVEELYYLEDLYTGILSTQNVSGALQTKQAQQICMISLELESRIREGADFDKLLSSYDKLVKVAEFTPKNVKNASDFDSVGELFHWLEKRGWKNQYFDNVTRDVLDEMMSNFENFNQRLYTNESGIGEEISRRVEQLKSANAMEQESFYGTDKVYDLDNYDNDGYDQLMKDEFKVDV